MPVFLELNNRNRGDSEQEMNTHVNKSNIKFLMLYNNICVVTNKSEVGSLKSGVRRLTIRSQLLTSHFRLTIFFSIP